MRHDSARRRRRGDRDGGARRRHLGGAPRPLGGGVYSGSGRLNGGDRLGEEAGGRPGIPRAAVVDVGEQTRWCAPRSVCGQVRPGSVPVGGPSRPGKDRSGRAEVYVKAVPRPPPPSGPVGQRTGRLNPTDPFRARCAQRETYLFSSRHFPQGPVSHLDRPGGRGKPRKGYPWAPAPSLQGYRQPAPITESATGPITRSSHFNRRTAATTGPGGEVKTYPPPPAKSPSPNEKTPPSEATSQ